MTLEPMARIDVEVAEEKVATPQANANAPPPSIGVRTLANTPDTAAQEGPQSIGINLVPTDPNSEVVGYWAEGLHEGPNMRADAPRSFGSVPPGKYLLQAGATPPWYLASAFCGGTDLIREPLVIVGSAAGCSIHAVFRNDAASLKVSVSHAGAGLVFIYAIPLDNLTRDVQQFSTTPDGKGSLDDLAPGRYLLLAMRQPEQLAFRDADTLRRYEAEGKRVDLAPGATADVQLDLVDEEPQAQ
jgi:hypothetical protein